VTAALEILADDLRALRRRFLDILERPLELETLMAIADEINALAVRIQAVTAALPADVATAVAAQKATDDAAAAATAQALADGETAVAAVTADVASLETAAGVQAVQ
jgi:hypothetical protein